MAKKDNNPFSLPSSPPPALFMGEKERLLIRQLNNEITDRIIRSNHIIFSH